MCSEWNTCVLSTAYGAVCMFLNMKQRFKNSADRIWNKKSFLSDSIKWISIILPSDYVATLFFDRHWWCNIQILIYFIVCSEVIWCPEVCHVHVFSFNILINSQIKVLTHMMMCIRSEFFFLHSLLYLFYKIKFVVINIRKLKQHNLYISFSRKCLSYTSHQNKCVTVSIWTQHVRLMRIRLEHMDLVAVKFIWTFLLKRSSNVSFV